MMLIHLALIWIDSVSMLVALSWFGMGFHRRLNIWNGFPLAYHDLELTSIVFRDVAYISSFGLTFNGSRPAIRVMSGRLVPTGLVCETSMLTRCGMSGRTAASDITCDGSRCVLSGRSGRADSSDRTYGSQPYPRGMMRRVVSFDVTCDGSRPARRGRSGREDSSDVTRGGSLPARRNASGRLDSSDHTRVGWRISLRGMSRRVGGL